MQPPVATAPTEDARTRCAWVDGGDALMRAYHDEEWGVPLHDDRALFELLTLEGAQAGLSWATVLGRREGYRVAFAGFDIARVAAFTEDDAARLLLDPGIIRNRAKVAATIANARAALEVQREHGSLDAYLWSFVDGAPLDGARRTLKDVPAQTDHSKAMSTALRKRGFGFVGPTICYALMQAAGLVNDHQLECYRYAEVSGAGAT